MRMNEIGSRRHLGYQEPRVRSIPADELTANYFSGKIDEISSVNDSASILGLGKGKNTESRAELKEKYSN